jgi:hypothetical protein
MNGDLERFGSVGLHIHSQHFPPFSFTLNHRALLWSRFLAVHVKVDLFRSWIAVVPKHYLLCGSHISVRVRSPVPLLVFILEQPDRLCATAASRQQQIPGPQTQSRRPRISSGYRRPRRQDKRYRESKKPTGDSGLPRTIGNKGPCCSYNNFANAP